MNNYTKEELKEALRPITSLISKSEKAQQKVPPGTWQHRMLEDNLKALRHAAYLINRDTADRDSLTGNDILEVPHAFASMISRTENAQKKYLPGTSHHTLLKNRLNAFRIAEALIIDEIGEIPPNIN